jgi:ABC-type lipoprotein export system ATPase subunit
VSAPLLTARGLVRRHAEGDGHVTALDGADLDLRAGELLAVTGPPGSGKSTLVRVLGGAETADAGEITWHGADPAAGDLVVLPPWIVLDEAAVLRDHVAQRVPAGGDEDPDALLAELGLTDLAGRRCGKMSLGEQQRAVLATALAAQPRALLADVPTGYLDLRATALACAALRRRCDGGLAALVVTHDPALLDAADRVLELVDGRLTP